MQASVLRLILALGLLSRAAGVVVEFSYKYDRVELKTGRTLSGVTFRSYDTLTGRVTAQSAREALTVRLDDLPGEIAARIRQRVPVQTAEEIREEKKKREEDAAAARRDVRERQERIEAQRRRETQPAEAKPAEPAGEAELTPEQKLAAAAKEFALEYFEKQAAASTALIYGPEMSLDSPEPVSGWSNRWRVPGKVAVSAPVRFGAKAVRKIKDFEMLLELTPGGEPQLLEINISRL